MQERRKSLSQRTQRLSVVLHRLRRDQHERDDAGARAAIDPVVQRALLHQRIARAQVDHCAVELHVDLARNHHRIVDRLGAMIARRDARLVFDQPEYRPVLGRPDVAALVTGPPRGQVPADLVDGDDGAALRVVVRHHAPDVQCHVHSTLTPESLISRSQRSYSVPRNAANSSGEFATTSNHCLSMYFSLKAGSLSTFFTSAYIAWVTSRGMPAGPA